MKHVFSLGPSPDAEDLIALAQKADATPLASAAVESDICWLVYTGGTTGRPKGVMDTHRVMASMAITAMAEYELPRNVRYLAASPITHAAGMHVVPTLLRGGTVYLHEKFDPERYLRTIESDRISLCFGVPSMVYALLDHPDLETTDLSSLETFLYAASPMSPARLEDATRAHRSGVHAVLRPVRVPGRHGAHPTPPRPVDPRAAVVVRQAGGDDAPRPAR